MVKTDAYAEARSLEQKLEGFQKKQAEELAQSPDQIRAKFAEKRRKAIAEASGDALKALVGMGKLSDDEVALAKAAARTGTLTEEKGPPS